MALSGSKDIGRNNSPRVQLEYDVRTGGATKKTELPWVMGVMADLSGNAAEGLEAVGKRSFAKISAENFDGQLKKAAPKLKFNVANKLAGEGEEGEMKVELSFQSMDDFSPAAVAKQVGPVAELLQIRERLSNLLATIDGNDEAEEALAAAIGDEAKLKQLLDAAGSDA